MSPVVDAEQPSPASVSAIAGGGDGDGGTGGGKFPKRQLSGDLKLRLARLPSLGGGGSGGGGGGNGGGEGGGGRRKPSSTREHGRRTIGMCTHRSNTPSICSSRRGYGQDGTASAVPRVLSMTSGRDGFSLVPAATASVAINGGVDSSRLNWVNPRTQRLPSTARSSLVSGRSGGGGGGGGDRVGAGVEAGGGGGASGGGGEDDDDHAEFMRELASQNGLQLGCSHGQDERARHRREVERRIEIQDNCVRRPSVGQSKSLLKAKILGSIGGGPFELLRAFRKMHSGRGTVIDFKGFREAVKKLGLGLTEPEIMDFFRSFDADGSGGIDFAEFCEWVGAINDTGDDDGGGGGENIRGGGGFRPSSGGSDKSVSKRKMRDAQAKVKAASEKVPTRTMAENEHLLRQKILGSIGGGPFEFLRAFRKMHRGRGTVVDLDDFREAVTTFSLGLGEPEVVAFFNGFDADGSGGIDFEEFCAWVGGGDAGGGEECIISDSKPTNSGGFSPFAPGGGGPGRGGGAGTGDEEEMTPAQKAQETVSRAFREQAAKMSSETLHKVLREKLISTVKPGGGTLLRTYHNLHRSGNVGEFRGVELADFKEAVHRYGMGVTDAQVERLFRRYDKDGSGDIDFHEFLKLIMYAEELAPEDHPARKRGDGGAAEEGGDEGGDVRPLSPGWASRAAAAAADDRDEQDGGRDTGDGKGDGSGGSGGSGGGRGATAGLVGAPGAPPHANNGSGLRREGQQQHLCESVLALSPATKGAKAEQKMNMIACVRNRWRHMLTAFRRRDPLRTGTVTFDEFQQALAENKAMQALGMGDISALASKHAAPRGRVDYPRFMRHLLIRNEGAGSARPAITGGVRKYSRQHNIISSSTPNDLRPTTSAGTRAAELRSTKSTGALAAAAPSPPSRRRSQHHLHPIDNKTTSRGGGGGDGGGDGGGGGNYPLRDRAISLCRELQPHIINAWKPLWRDLKAADQLTAAKAKCSGSYNSSSSSSSSSSAHGGGGGNARSGTTTSYAGVSTGEVETHVFSAVLARHGLELSNRDLMALEHLPAMTHKGWALPAAQGRRALLSSSSAAAARGAAAGAATEGRKGGGGGSGRIPYDSFLTTCLKSAVR
ncbi:unnamed protein product [Pylaiella littoralis]